MAINADLITMLRFLINDINTPQTYTDARLGTCLAVAAMGVINDFSFDNVMLNPVGYTINIGAPDIQPDPLNPASFDPIAIYLFTLKAACITNTNSYQGAIGVAIKVRNSDDAVDTTERAKSYKDLLDVGPCQMYQDAVWRNQYKKSMMQGKAVSTPLSRYDFLLSSPFRGPDATSSMGSFYNGMGTFL